MIRKLLLTAVAVLLAVAAVQGLLLWRAPQPTQSGGQQPAASAAEHAKLSPEAIKDKLKSSFGQADAIAYQPETGLYEVRIGGQIVYVTADGGYLISGSVYDIATRENLTQQAMGGVRRDVLAGIDPGDAIVFAPKGETKHVVWVFTDITCPYCRKFHRQIADYNKRGIEVRYLAFPRGGPGSKGWQLAQSVWCASNRQTALTRAKASQTAAGGGDCDSPVPAEYQAGRAVGLRGTPMLLSAKGRVLGGYLSPEELASKLGNAGSSGS